MIYFKKSGGSSVPNEVETILEDFQPLCSLAILHNFITLFCSEKIHSAQQVFLLLLQRTSNSISHLLNYDSVPNFSFSHCFIRVPFTVMGRMVAALKVLDMKSSLSLMPPQLFLTRDASYFTRYSFVKFET